MNSPLPKFLLSTLSGALFVLSAGGCRPPASETALDGVPVHGVEVVQSFPHDRRAFTQGLQFHDGFIYESTGLRGQTSLRQVELETGRVRRRVDLPPPYFGEGIAIVDNRIYMLTWQEQTCLVFALDDFRLLQRFPFEGEGWGLAFDGEHLVMSDGSDQLQFRRLEDFSLSHTVSVRAGNTPVERLNELAWIDGEIWANIFQSYRIARIDPRTGQVRAWLDLDGILAPEHRRQRVDVMNGIAYDEASGRIFVTGKWWPVLFEIRPLQSLRGSGAVRELTTAGVGYEIDWDRVQRLTSEWFEPAVVTQWELPDPQEWRAFWRTLVRALEAHDLVDLAWIRNEAEVALYLLRATPGMEMYADWLEPRLDYLRVAETAVQRQFPQAEKERRPPPASAPSTRPPISPPRRPPAQPSLDRATTGPALELVRSQAHWEEVLAGRREPAGAREWVSRLKPIFEDEGIPAHWVWIAEVESTFNPAARSPAGAVGLFQFMPATAERFGLALRPRDERLDPIKNARAAAQYLRILHARFHSWPLALAAYNAGEGRVGRLLREHQGDSFESIAPYLPSETQMYVPKVLATVRLREKAEGVANRRTHIQPGRKTMPTLFTKIIHGEIPCHRLAEDEHHLAFLDIRPIRAGHALVIPKEEVDYLFDLEDQRLASLLCFAKPLAKAIERVVPCQRIGVVVMGLEVPHAHMHLIPIDSMQDIDFALAQPAEASELEALAEKIRAAI